MFDFLSRADSPEVPGTGIGLATCKRIIGEMGGRIWVDAKPGEGATFCFRLPSSVIARQPVVLMEATQKQEYVA